MLLCTECCCKQFASILPAVPEGLHKGGAIVHSYPPAFPHTLLERELGPVGLGSFKHEMSGCEIWSGTLRGRKSFNSLTSSLCTLEQPFY